VTRYANEELLAQARAWAADDPDPHTRAELLALIDAENIDQLADRFSGLLQFGTAGLRGELGAGPNRMNRVVVAKAAAGLASYVLATGGHAVVIGYDARRNSDVFARDTAEVLTGAGLAAMVLPEPLPTPVLAFAIRHLGCAAGVMVTASHNPPNDNGYKVYVGDGSQIVPPTDSDIADRIAAVGNVAVLPRGGEWVTLGDEVLTAYRDRVLALVDPEAPKDLAITYTPMHGVGGALLVDVLQRAGFGTPTVTAAQFAPDPAFPTVAFPNPEEPGAMDQAVTTAAAADSDIILANDPDADRCAVGIRSDGGYRMLRGDEVGVLLGDYLIRRGAHGTYANSIVSSSMLGRICAAAGVQHTETLTGFKWISKVEDLAYGYEEALGYCVDPAGVNDKDGVSAALLIAQLADEEKAAGRTLADRLDDLYRTHGLHATDQLSVRVDDLSLIAGAMQRLRTDPPSHLGFGPVQGLDDLSRGDGGLPPTDGLRFRLDGGRVIVRPSGTEPKLKCYLEVVVDVTDSLETARDLAAERLAALRADIGAATGLA
jgi:phosphomannomutase